MKLTLRESRPGEFMAQDAPLRAHEALEKALREVAPRGAEWDLVRELAKSMEADYRARLDKLQKQVEALVP